MQLEKEDRRLLLHYLNIIMVEAIYDYSSFEDFSVVCINGNRFTMNRESISKLKRVILKLEGEI